MAGSTGTNLPLKKRTVIQFLRRVMGPSRYTEWRNAWLFGEPEDPVMLQPLPEIQVRWPEPGKAANGPVFLISPTQRSGSTFIHELLALHPGLFALSGKNGLPAEFFLHTYGEALKAYVEKTTAAWDTWIKGEKDRDIRAHRLFSSIGSGMLQGLATEAKVGTDHRLLLRAPDSRGVRHLFHLFPDATVVLLFRDGRDTAVSFINSWGSDSVFDAFAERWAARTDEMLAFENEAKARGYGKQVIRMHYEDVVSDPEAAIKKILPDLHLRISEFPFDQVDRVPLLGTSEEKDVHWEPVSKPENFNPLQRWKSWSKEKQNRFESLAGDQLHALGYTNHR